MTRDSPGAPCCDRLEFVDQGFIDEAHGALSANGLSLDARPFALEEREKILVDLILVCRAHPVGRALVDL